MPANPDETDTSKQWAVGALREKSVPDQSPEALSKLAKDIAMNLVFTDRHIRNDRDLGMVFMPLILGAFADATDEYKNDIGLIYEYYDKAGPRSINGYPIFFSLAFVSKKDAKIVWEKVEKIQKIMEDV